jgi:AcrR family transcriptional regulator
VSTAVDNLTPRAREIVTTAREVLEERGSSGLSMRILAERLGMRAPSLYKHFSSKEALEAVLISVGFEEQAALFRSALNTSQAPLIAMGTAYRKFARENPQLYRLMYDRTLNRSLLIPGTEEAAAAPSIEATGEDEDLARAAWAFAHGMTILELNARFTPGADLDAAWRRGLATLQSATRGRTRNASPGAGSNSGRGT